MGDLRFTVVNVQDNWSEGPIKAEYMLLSDNSNYWAVEEVNLVWFLGTEAFLATRRRMNSIDLEAEPFLKILREQIMSTLKREKKQGLSEDEGPHNQIQLV